MAANSKPSASILYAVKRLELVIRARLDGMLRGSGVTTLQYTALTVLDRRDRITAAQLARDSFVTPQAMADMLGALESRALISRLANPLNGRERLVLITVEGRAFVGRYADAAREIEEQMTADLTAARTETFVSALHTAWRSLRLDRS